MSNSKILFKISGSIAAYKSADVISKLVQAGHEVQAVVTNSALNFIGPATLEGLTGKPVMSDSFKEGRMMAHIDLVKWADLTILAPATATSINRLGYGLGEDLVSALFLAHDWAKPYFVAPAMNTKMLSHPATREGLERLKKWGVCVLSPNDGTLACGDVGPGRMMEPADILAAIQPFLEKTIRPSVLLTAGGTKEPIDTARFISNMSSGKTAAAVAERFIQHNWEVTYLASKESVKPNGQNKSVEFSSSKNLQIELDKLLSENSFDAVIHLAAVSDFAPIHSNKMSKISSNQDTLILEMERTPKLVNAIREKCKNKNMRLIAFKFTATNNSATIKEKVKKLFQNSGADWIVQNDVSSRKDGVQSDFNLFDQNGEISSVNHATELGDLLENMLKKVIL
ncbi:MAG: bifunctional phosphopantothenoylcysteine decarboxylase/phosphopantothenate--cysteine ligase CoaBC [Candidatus Marinimicrobia bacterium]|nr:bifunctional phosphopantothenoylcysteine decarboxylase/phosphopantothenate--cysteine ligase CoaBC [Candidatus Neomarinimicrobiota bacterium]MBT4753549.1 bifunctional phosphopantothenoylcysteine decarboxylase/phosphopantothenate--cysteine ligase CoaBC [Candidatus Neomarinimicrobiota bacterium]